MTALTDPPLSRSYPYLDISRRTGSDYGDVLHFGVLIERDWGNALAGPPQDVWEARATQRLSLAARMLVVGHLRAQRGGEP